MCDPLIPACLVIGGVSAACAWTWPDAWPDGESRGGARPRSHAERVRRRRRVGRRGARRGRVSGRARSHALVTDLGHPDRQRSWAARPPRNVTTFAHGRPAAHQLPRPSGRAPERPGARRSAQAGALNRLAASFYCTAGGTREENRCPTRSAAPSRRSPFTGPSRCWNGREPSRQDTPWTHPSPFSLPGAIGGRDAPRRGGQTRSTSGTARAWRSGTQGGEGGT